MTIKDITEDIHFNRVWIPMMVQDSQIMTPYNLQKRMVQSYGQEWLSGRNISELVYLHVKNDIFTTLV